MKMDIATLVDLKRNPKIPTLAPGDTVKVYVKVIEGERERIQMFQGVVIKMEKGATGNFTVRRVAYGTGTERTFPLNSTLIDKVEVIRHGTVRRAKLFYLRGLTTKKARLKEKRIIIKPEVEAVEATGESTIAPAEVPSAEMPAEQTASGETNPQDTPKAQVDQPASSTESETKQQ
jgi:large subunit ribosomal protein L19